MEFSFNTKIARITHSADEAVFVHRIWYLTMNNEVNERNFFDGKYWTYDSVQALAKVFDFWSPKQLRRIIQNCVKLNLIETGQYAENPFDRRCWYAVTELVQSIYRDGQTDLPKQANGTDGTGECSGPNGQMYIGPNGQMIKGAIKDQLKDLREGAPAPVPVRESYGEFGNVKLTPDELERLYERWGETLVQGEIEELSAYMASRGKRYKNHCATLSNWLRRKYPDGVLSAGPEGEEWIGG